MQHTIDQEVLYRLPDVVNISGKARSTIYRDIRAGEFPAPVQLGAQSVAWRKTDLDQWIASRPVATAANRTVPRRVSATRRGRA